MPEQLDRIPERLEDEKRPGLLVLEDNICPYCKVDVIIKCRRSDGSLWRACFFCWRVERVA